ncbi:MAG: hypothetical protein LBP58_01410 [Azoarcus sp.]|jgi:hypothetical protein|nr:hypothetical protein [Azoarcus sp.]
MTTTVLKRTPDLGIGIRLQRPDPPVSIDDNPTGVGWLTPLRYAGFSVPDDVNEVNTWLPARIRFSVLAGSSVVTNRIDSQVVGVVSGETVAEIKWSWSWNLQGDVSIDVDVFPQDGHLRVTLNSITGIVGSVATLSAMAETASGFSRYIALVIEMSELRPR